MAMLMLVSCRLDNGTGTHRTPAAVENYTSGLMYSVVVNSTEFLDEAIVLDTYLKLSEEERLKAYTGKVLESLSGKQRAEKKRARRDCF